MARDRIVAQLYVEADVVDGEPVSESVAKAIEKYAVQLRKGEVKLGFKQTEDGPMVPEVSVH